MKWQPIQQIQFSRQVDCSMQKDFSDIFDFDQCCKYNRPHIFKDLILGKRSYNAGVKYDTPMEKDSWIDHGEVYKQKGTNYVMATGHLYASMSQALQNVNKVIKPLGLRAVIYDSSVSWYFPNNTVLVSIMSDETFNYFESRFKKLSHNYLTI